MDFKELAATRRSIRKFKSDPVSKDDITDIVNTAINAANAGNQQMWHFTIVTDAAIKNQMVEIVSRKIETVAAKTDTEPQQLKPVINSATLFAGAPTVVVVSTGQYRSPADKLLVGAGYNELEIDVLRCRPDLQSIGAAIQMFMLAAWEKGYGTCYMTGPMIARPELEALFAIQEPRSLAALIAVGKPEIIPATRGRKAVQEILTFLD